MIVSTEYEEDTSWRTKACSKETGRSTHKPKLADKARERMLGQNVENIHTVQEKLRTIVLAARRDALQCENGSKFEQSLGFGHKTKKQR